MGPGMVALEPGDLDFQRNLPQAADGNSFGSFRLLQLPSKRCWEAARQLCPALVPPVPALPAVPSVPSGLPEVAMQLAAVDEAEVISVEDEEPQVQDASLREAVPSLREAAPSLTLGESMHQIVEIDPEECKQAESIPKEQHLGEPAGPPGQVVPEAETVVEGFGCLGGSQVDQFGPQARAAFRPPRGREVETAGAPTLQGQPLAMVPAVPAAFQGCDGSLLGPAARHQFKKPRVLATPARAVSSFSPIGEGATTLNAAAPKLPQSTAGLICSAADLLRAHRGEHREHREHRV